MGGKAIMPDVVTYLSARPGQPVELSQLAQGLGIEDHRVQKALSNAISQGIYGNTLQCIHRGRVWMWHGDGQNPAPAVAPTTFNAAQPRMPKPPVTPAPKVLAVGDVIEVMGVTQAGDAVARDGDGKLYRVSPL